MKKLPKHERVMSESFIDDVTFSYKIYLKKIWACNYKFLKPANFKITTSCCKLSKLAI